MSPRCAPSAWPKLAGSPRWELRRGREPKPGRSEFLIEVRAAALNHADLYQRDGKSQAPAGAPDILGVEVAGIVATADPSGRFTIGTPVMGLLSGGGYAEYAAMDAGLAVEIPLWAQFCRCRRVTRGNDRRPFKSCRARWCAGLTRVS